MSPAAGEAEDDEHVGLSRQQFGQVAVDRFVSRRKNMACDVDPREGRAAPARQRSCETTARV